MKIKALFSVGDIDGENDVIGSIRGYELQMNLGEYPKLGEYLLLKADHRAITFVCRRVVHTVQNGVQTGTTCAFFHEGAGMSFDGLRSRARRELDPLLRELLKEWPV